MSTRLARSVGPHQLIRVLQDGAPLNTPDQEVTFLTRVDDASADACDAWSYGGGSDLGIFLILDDSNLTLHTEPRAEDQHEPGRAPGHLWVWNDDSPLLADRAVLVRDPHELRLTLPLPDPDAARDALRQHRGVTDDAFREERIKAARQLADQCERLLDLQEQLLQLDQDRLSALLDPLGLPADVLHRHPERHVRALREAIEQAARGAGILKI